MTDIVQSSGCLAAPAITATSQPILKSSSPRSRPTKSSAVIKLLSRAKGATLAEVGVATGWQPHSTRAFLTGLRKKGNNLIKEQRPDGSTAYRIVALVSAVTAP